MRLQFEHLLARVVLVSHPLCGSWDSAMLMCLRLSLHVQLACSQASLCPLPMVA